MYTCNINKNAPFNPKKITILDNITWVVAWNCGLSLVELGHIIAEDCLCDNYRPFLIVLRDGVILIMDANNKDVVCLTITQVTQEPAPAILVVESQDKFGDFVADYPRAFLDTTEGMVAALSYIEGLRKDEESSVTTCTISRMVLDKAAHTYQAQIGHVGKTEF